MDREIIPMVTSIIAIVFSAFTLGWNVYKDAIRKPKFRVSLSIQSIHQKDKEPEGPLIFLEALNLGPTPNRIGVPFAWKSWFTRRFSGRDSSKAFIYPDFSHWANTRASSRIEVGDKATFIFPYSKEGFLKEDFVHIGVSDGFGRMHWASKRDVRVARLRYRKDFQF